MRTRLHGRMGLNGRIGQAVTVLAPDGAIQSDGIALASMIGRRNSRDPTPKPSAFAGEAAQPLSRLRGRTCRLTSVPPRRTNVDLTEQQLRAIEQFHGARRMQERATQAVGDIPKCVSTQSVSSTWSGADRCPDCSQRAASARLRTGSIWHRMADRAACAPQSVVCQKGERRPPGWRLRRAALRPQRGRCRGHRCR